ncbi:MAG: helix-turn-helix domain-containing protein, partial [Planctomycetes bacterium]|nr:helix-turn-helix domain-containing protein [Planctomycetota bacterium]
MSGSGLKIKYKAPAVHQAILVLEFLMSAGPSTLQKISTYTGVSKATLLRILETLEAHAWVCSDPSAKTYTAAVRVLFKSDGSGEREQQIQETL